MREGRELGEADDLVFERSNSSSATAPSASSLQRVAIVRALAHDPALVLADEPTGNLDAETAEQVLDLLGRSLRDRGKTLVMATHSREAAASADRVLRVEDGKLVELQPRFLI